MTAVFVKKEHKAPKLEFFFPALLDFSIGTISCCHYGELLEKRSQVKIASIVNANPQSHLALTLPQFPERNNREDVNPVPM